MSQNINLKSILNSFTLLLIAGIIGLIVSLVAQLFMVMAKNVYYFIFNNKDFVLTIEIAEISLNLIPLLVCIPSSILVGLLMYYLIVLLVLRFLLLVLSFFPFV